MFKENTLPMKRVLSSTYFFKTSSVILLSAIFSIPVSADILYTADFESDIRSITRDSYSYPPLRKSGNAPEIVAAENGVTPRGGSHMMKSYLHRYNSNVTYRTEAVAAADQNFTGSFEKGKDYWLGVSVYFPADWSMDYDGINRNGDPITGSNGMVLQFHDRSYRDDSWRSGLPFVIRHSKEGFIIGVRDSGCRGRPECLNNPDITNTINRFSERAPLLRGQWNDFVIHVKWSPESDGILNVWINGKEVLNSKGPNYHSEVPADAYPYFKMGQYYGSTSWGDKGGIKWNVIERTVYHDELRIGDAASSYEEVAPGNAQAPTTEPETPVATTPVEDAETPPSEITPEETTPEETTSTESTPIVTPAAPSLAEADSSLVAYYSFNDLSGSTVPDDNGGQHNGSLHGPVTAPGKVGAALSFDGVDDYVDVPGFDVFEGALTLSAWIKADDFGNHEARIISKSTGIEEQDHTWMLSTIENNGSKLRFRLKTNEITTTLFGSTTIPAGEWVHAAATYDGANMRLYFNGVEDASTAKGGTISTNPSVGVRIGDNPVSGSRNFNGLIDELRVHSSALSGDQIKQLME